MILTIDTSAAILRMTLTTSSGALISSSERSMPSERGVHDAFLALDVERLLSAENAGLENLSKFALVVGPGSFTGLRIGVAFAKGTAFAIGTPLAAVTAHEVLHKAALRQFDPSGSHWLISESYRKNMVYVSNSARGGIEPIAAELLESRLGEDPAAPRFIHGDALECSGEVYRLSPSLEDLANAGYTATPMAMEEVERFEPLYLEEFITGRS